MSEFWSGWVMALVTLNLGITLFLFFWAQSVDIPMRPDGTTGHVWGGAVRESLHRLPAWWVMLSVVGFVSAIGCLVLYPGFGSNKGALGWTSHQQLAGDVAANASQLDPMLKRFDALSVEQLAATPEATRIGHRLFVDNCAACHGIDARGGSAVGAPDLTDGDWLWGGTAQVISTTILDGRTGVMPPFGASFDAKTIENLANYVLSLSNSPHSAPAAAAGKAMFTVCAACHGADGTGNPALGAPNLTVPKRLYGSSLATIEQTIKNGRTGAMPAWRQRLGESDVRLITAWVYAQSSDAAPAAPR